VIAGPNGSGKSSVAGQLDYEGRENLLDPDAIAYRMDPANLHRVAVAAGREVIRRTREYLDRGVSFAIETTLSSGSILETMRAARERGFIVQLIFICLDTPERNIQRVGERVSRGGHDVPPADVRRRYMRSLSNLPAALKLAHKANLYDNTGDRARLAIEAYDGKITRRSDSDPAWVIEAVWKALPDPCVTIPSMALTQVKSQLMSASEIDRTLVRLAHEILEKTKDLEKLAFIGIRRRGVPLAARLAAKIEALENRAIPVGILDINLYRDDLSTVGVKPQVNDKQIDFSVEERQIILMDDVLYTGRTVRAALDALFDHGRPAVVQLLVLIDRGHRELPIEAQYVGRTIQTSDTEIIEVKFQEIDSVEKVLLCECTPAAA
jgi:pyrimidine operon attenuation protein/uracil phosphoribosyltransferase